MKLMIIVQNVVKNFKGIWLSKTLDNLEEALLFLDNISHRLDPKGEESLLLRIEQGFCYLHLNRLYECEDKIKSLKSLIEKRFEVDPIIYRNFYKLSAFHNEKKRNYDEFYNNSIQYLAYAKESVSIHL
jgi:hypothetical protein